MNEEECSSRDPTDIALLLLLGILVTVPAVAIQMGFEGDRVAFVVYREPKLVAFMTLGWAMLGGLAWLRLGNIPTETLVSIGRRAELLLLGTFVFYASLTLLWATVPKNGFYELIQYLVLFPLVFVLLAWNSIDRRVRSTVQACLVASLAFVTMIGIIQAMGWISLIPINPYDEVAHPSLTGYKNLAALAVLGQWFLLAQFAIAPERSIHPILRPYLWTALIVEFAYLVSLQSRSAYLGLTVGFAYLLATRSAWRQRRTGAILLATFAVAGLLIILFMSPRVRAKMSSALHYVTHPASYLESDRGTYLLNTINMVGDRPLGVGLGDWQTQYPVYRLHNREVAFSEEYQARRAHSDYVQILGETGWPGLILWILFLLTVVILTTRHGIQTGNRSSLFCAAQLVALATAMASDYVTEVPYGKFQFFLVVFLCMSSTQPDCRTRAVGRVHPLAVPAVAMVVSAAMVVNIIYFYGLARKIHVSAQATRAYFRAMESDTGTIGTQNAPARLANLTRVVTLAGRSDHISGHTKTMFRYYLIVADAWYRLGNSEMARRYALSSLRLHPNHPNSFRLMARLVSDPEVAREWDEAADYILDRARHGFERPYPPGHPLAHSD